MPTNTHRKPSILFILSSSSAQWGASTVACSIIPALQNRGFAVSVIVPEKTGDGTICKLLADESVQSISLDYRTWCFSTRSRAWQNTIRKFCAPLVWVYNSGADRELRKVIQRMRADLVVVFDGTIGTGYIAAKKEAVPSIGYLQAVPWKGLGKSFFSKSYVKGCLKSTKRTIAISDYVAEEWNLFLDGVRCDVVPNSFSLSKVAREGNREDTSIIRVVLLGGMTEPKGQIHLVRAAGILVNSGKRDFSIDFIGGQQGDSSYQRMVEEEIRSNNLSANINLLPYCEDVSQEWKSAHIVASACAAEGFGLSVLEGMVSGCLAIGPDCGGVYELIKDGRGIVYRFGDDEDLARKLACAFDAIRSGDSIVERGMEYARGFTLEKQIGAFERNISACLESPCLATGDDS